MEVFVSTITGNRYEVEESAFTMVRYREYDPYLDEYECCFVKIYDASIEEAQADVIDLAKIYAEANKAEEENEVLDFEVYATGKALEEVRRRGGLC